MPVAGVLSPAGGINITGLSAGAIVTADQIPFYNVSASANRKITYGDFRLAVSEAFNATFGVQLTAAEADITSMQFEIAALAGLLENGSPVGAVLAFPGTVLPTGFLWCRGAAISRVIYGALFAVFGVTHGQGDGSTTFLLPDYRGRFLRGVDETAARDPDRTTRLASATGGATGNAPGSTQAQQLLGHGHGATITGGEHGHPVNAAQSSQGQYANPGVGGQPFLLGNGNAATASGGAHSHTVAVANSTGTETRPVNIYTNFIVRHG